MPTIGQVLILSDNIFTNWYYATKKAQSHFGTKLYKNIGIRKAISSGNTEELDIVHLRLYMLYYESKVETTELL